MKRGTLIALGAFAVLLVLVLATREPQVSVGVRKLDLPKLDKAQVTGLELTGARSATLRKEGDGWKVADPSRPDAKYAADESLVTAALDALGQVKNPDFVTDRADRLKVVLHLGRQSESKDGSAPVAARVDGDAQVYQLAPYVASQLRKRLVDFRDLGLFRFEPDKVTKLKLQAVGRSVVAVKEGGGWKLAEPRKLPDGFEFEPSQVDMQLAWLRGLRGTRVVEGPVTEGQAGLASPAVLVEVTVEGEPVQTLRLGREAPGAANGAKELYARTTLDALTYAVGDGVRARLDQGVELFKRRSPPPGLAGAGQLQGLESLPPDVRQQLEAQLRAAQ